MVIEKFLALSMIAFGLAASAVDATRTQPVRSDNPRGGRRRVRWLRQHLAARGAGGSRAPRSNGERN
jgi:hypothetical protein